MDIHNIRQLLKTKTIYDIPMRVTFYARVSSESDEQLNSLGNQIQYYENLIRKNTNWTYVEGYIDEGLSAATTKKRENFHRMVEDGRAGLFDLVITKEITRFARNTLDSIQYTRELLNAGVGVFFQNDNINTIILSDSREGSIQFFQNRRIQSIQRLRVINFNRANIILFIDN